MDLLQLCCTDIQIQTMWRKVLFCLEFSNYIWKTFKLHQTLANKKILANKNLWLLKLSENVDGEREQSFSFPHSNHANVY